MMIAALGLGHTFGRGMWGRVWLGLLAFVISDALYSYVSFTGMYALSVESGNILSLVVDVIYALAYMLVALAAFNQYLLVRYGPSLRPRKDDL
jgi:preprotein translocase subunit SecF